MVMYVNYKKISSRSIYQKLHYENLIIISSFTRICSIKNYKNIFYEIEFNKESL